MQLERPYQYRQPVLSAGQLRRALQLSLEGVIADPAAARFSVEERLSDGTTVKQDMQLTGMVAICDLSTTTIVLRERFQDGGLVYLSITSYSRTVLNVLIEAPGPEILEGIRRGLEEGLGLEVLTDSSDADLVQAFQEVMNERFASFGERLSRLEDAVAFPRRLRCFLAHRFSEETEIVALRVQQFLSLLDVEVLSGGGYEPRQVQVKVGSKFKSLDFVVVLITSSGESMWTRDEIALASNTGVPLIPIVEKGAGFERGLLGDLEYVEYERGHIGDAFIKLLQGIQFIREKIAAGA